MEIRQVTSQQLPRVAGVLGRALTVEPMVTWPLGDEIEDLEDRCSRLLLALDEPLVELGMLIEADNSLGAALWVPPSRHQEFWTAADSTIDAQLALVDDGGRRFERLWGWVTSRIPQEPMWLLDHIGVDPPAQGRGVGQGLIRWGLECARHDGVDAFVETGVARNVDYYQRFGFEVVDHGRIPGGGIPIWFLRWRHPTRKSGGRL
jgi:GNAT superfamily N-acetyltransferase